MPITPTLQAALTRHYAHKATKAKADAVRVKHGAEIFAGGDYPQRWEDFVGQDAAVTHLRAHLDSVDLRNAPRLDHILLASGLHGIGKTTLAMLIAANARTGVTEMGSTPGLVEVSGPMTVEDGRRVGTWRDRWAQRARVQQAYYDAHPERFHEQPHTPAPAGYVGINLPDERKNELERLQTG